MVAPPAFEPGKDTSVYCHSRLHHFALGRPPLLTMRWPSATGLTSYLSGCFWFTSQRCVFYIANIVETFPICHCRSVSRFECSVCLVFRRLSLGGRREGQSARVIRSVQLRFTQVRNQPGLLNSVWNGFSSLLTARLLIRVADSARTPSEEPVNPASISQLGGQHLKGLSQSA